MKREPMLFTCNQDDSSISLRILKAIFISNEKKIKKNPMIKIGLVLECKIGGLLFKTELPFKRKKSDAKSVDFI